MFIWKTYYMLTLSHFSKKSCSLMCHLALRLYTHTAIPSHPVPLVSQTTSKLHLHQFSKWNNILARYGEAELAVYLATFFFFI